MNRRGFPEAFHNRCRCHPALGMLTTIEYEFRINQAEPVAGPHSSIPTPGNLSTAPGDTPPEDRASPPAAVTSASTPQPVPAKTLSGQLTHLVDDQVH